MTFRTIVSAAALWGCCSLPLLSQRGPASTVPGPLPQALDSYIAAAIADLGLPGAAVTVVKDGQILVGVYGVRELGKPGRIDPSTIFDIASVTKSFTSAVIATLVDEGRMSWDDPVRRFIPELRLTDENLAAGLTIRDLLAHRSGIAPQNRPLFIANLDRREIIASAALMEIAAPVRSRWIYSNFGYTLAGEAAARAANSTWEQLVRERLLVPLGMARSTSEFMSAPAMGNLAVGHAMFGGTQRAVPRGGMSRVQTAPAGAVQASPADLGAWMLLHLGGGGFSGKRIVSPDAMSEMHASQVHVPTSESFRAARQLRYAAGYGLGWQIFDYRGTPMFWHSGNGDGQLAFVALLPDAKLGVSIVVNSWKAGAGFNLAILSRVFDHYLNAPARDYVGEFKTSWVAGNGQRQAMERSMDSARARGTSPSLPLRGYTATYLDRLNLPWHVSAEGDSLRLQYANGERGTLRHWHHDTFRLTWDSPLMSDDPERPVFVSFAIGRTGTAERFRLESVPATETVDAVRPQRP